jgi:hypothetical protein
VRWSFGWRGLAACLAQPLQRKRGPLEINFQGKRIY